MASLPRAVLVRCAGVDVARARVRGAPVIPVAAALRLAFVVSVVWGGANWDSVGVGAGPAMGIGGVGGLGGAGSGPAMGMGVWVV